MRAAAVMMACALTTACGWTPPDEQVLTKFFEESRLYDRALLAQHAAVVFNPRTDGVVQRFEVVSRGADEYVTPERVRRQVTLRADVRGADGRVASRSLAVTLERQSDRWMVTAFR